MEKRYLVYYWSKSDAESIERDYEQTLEELLDKDQFSNVADYGQKVGESDDEEEALEFSSKYADNCSYYDMVSIWDSEERKWFN